MCTKKTMVHEEDVQNVRTNVQMATQREPEDVAAGVKQPNFGGEEL